MIMFSVIEVKRPERDPCHVDGVNISRQCNSKPSSISRALGLLVERIAADADFERFCASIGETPSDPVHARLMEDGEVDFFNVDAFYDMELPRA